MTDHIPYGMTHTFVNSYYIRPKNGYQSTPKACQSMLFYNTVYKYGTFSLFTRFVINVIRSRSFIINGYGRRFQRNNLQETTLHPAPL